MTVVTQYLNGLFSLFKLLRLLRLPDYIVDYLVAPSVNLLFSVPHVTLRIVVFLDPEAVMNGLSLKTLHLRPP